jgi:hypothetical protein
LVPQVERRRRAALAQVQGELLLRCEWERLPQTQAQTAVQREVRDRSLMMTSLPPNPTR